MPNQVIVTRRVREAIVTRRVRLVEVATRGPQGAPGTSDMPVAFFVPGPLVAELKKPSYISPVAGTLSVMRGSAFSGSGATYRLVLNGSPLTTSASTDQTVVSTALSSTVQPGDKIQIEVVAAGTAADLSVTGVITV